MSDIKIDWSIVFNLNSFLIYFDLESRIEFSLVSRLIRNKSKPGLFNKLQFDGYKFKNYFNFNNYNDDQINLINYYSEHLLIFWRLIKIKDRHSHEFNNSLDFSIIFNELNKGLKGIGSYVKSFEISALAHLFYFLDPITFNLVNLTSLEIRFCNLSLLTLLRIGDSLKKLKILKLAHVGLIQLTKKEYKLSEVKFSETLEELNIGSITVLLLEHQPKINELIRNFIYLNSTKLSNLHAFTIPNLKRLKIDYIDKNYIQKLLKLNTKIEELVIEKENVSQADYNQLAISENVTKLALKILGSNDPIVKSYEDSVVPKFNYIKRLELEFIHESDLYVEEYYDILINFPNLTHFTLDLTYYNFYNCDINEFLRTNLGSVNQLEALTLNAYSRDYNEYDDNWDSHWYDFEWSIFINVKRLILDLIELKISNIDFDSLPSDLVEIRFESSDIDSDLKYIRENINNYCAWIIWVYGNEIQFTIKNN